MTILTPRLYFALATSLGAGHVLMFILEAKSKKPKKLYCIERLRNEKIFRYEGFRVG